MTSRTSYVALMGVAIILAFSFFARHMIGIAILGNRYTPLVYNSGDLLSTYSNFGYRPDDGIYDETTAYARYTQEILRGEFLGATGGSFNGYLKRGSVSDTAWYRDRLGPAVLAFIAISSGYSVPNAFMIADLLLPFGVAFVLLVMCRRCFAFSLSQSAVATAAVMWLNWGDVIRLYECLIGGTAPNGATFLRTPYPQLSFLAFLVFLIALIQFHRKPSRMTLVFVGVSLLLNMYTYFYAWMLAVIVAVIYALLNSHEGLAARILHTAPKLKLMFFVCLLVVAALSAPVWANIVIGGDESRDSFVRALGVYTHWPSLKQSLAVAPLLAISLTLDRTSWANQWIWSLIWAGSLIALNQQLFSGKVLQVQHWTGAMLEPLAVLFCCDILFRFWVFSRDASIVKMGQTDRLARFLGLPVALAVIAQIYYVDWVGAKAAAPYNRMDAPFSELVTFLGEPSLRNVGFLSDDPYLREILPAYVVQKPLMPSYLDPLTSVSIKSLHNAAVEQFGAIIGLLSKAGDAGAKELRFDENKVIFILNRDRAKLLNLESCQIVFENINFVVASARKCN